MELEYAFIATAAQVNDDGRFSVIGGATDTLRASKLPCAAPPLAVVIKLNEYENGEAKDHTIELTVSSPEGKESTLLAGHPFSLSRRLPNLPAGVTIVINAALHMDTPGEHRLHVRIDGQEMRSLPLFVVLNGDPGTTVDERQP